MKTVFKKMLSLVLVAILLVSAVPFQALAAEGENFTLTVNYNAADGSAATLTMDVEAGSIVRKAAVQDAIQAASDVKVKECASDPAGEFPIEMTKSKSVTVAVVYKETEEDPTTAPTTEPTEHVHEYTSEVTTAATCTADGVKTFTCSAGDDTYTEVIPATGHSWGEWQTTTAATTTSEGVQTRTCACGATETRAIEKLSPKYITFINDMTGVTERKEYGSVNDVIVTPAQGEFQPGYSFRGWKPANNGTMIDEGKTYKVLDLEDTVYYASYKKTTEEDTNTLNVYVRRYVGGSRKETVLIHTKKNLMSNDKVLEYLDTVKAELYSTIEEQFPGYTWSGNYYNYYGDEVATANNLTTDGTKNIYINIYSQNETDVLVYVFTSSKNSYDRLIEMNGYEKGETVTYNSVLTQVKKYYSGSDMTMTMYDGEGWEDYKDGKSNTSTKGVNVKSDGTTTKIYVRLKNSSSSGSDSSTADSTNPKTGDEIFMAVTVLAVSASALALCFYMNKKRLAK